MSFDAAQVIAGIIHSALSPKSDDYQNEARAVIAAIQEDTQRGAMLRQAVLGIDENHAVDWARLDKTAAYSAQSIEIEAPHTADLLVEMAKSKAES